MENIIVDPQELWEYFSENEEELAYCMYKIASNEDYGVEIYATMESGNPEIVVEEDDEEIYREGIISVTDCKETAERVYEDFITNNVMKRRAIETVIEENDEASEEEFAEDGVLEELEEEIGNREADLDDAIYQFCCIAANDDSGYTLPLQGEIFEDLKDHFLEYMARKWNLPVYRPMFLEDPETKEEFYQEYPYDYMESECMDDVETDKHASVTTIVTASDFCSGVRGYLQSVLDGEDVQIIVGNKTINITMK